MTGTLSASADWRLYSIEADFFGGQTADFVASGTGTEVSRLAEVSTTYVDVRLDVLVGGAVVDTRTVAVTA